MVYSAVHCLYIREHNTLQGWGAYTRLFALQKREKGGREIVREREKERERERERERETEGTIGREREISKRTERET